MLGLTEKDGGSGRGGAPWLLVILAAMFLLGVLIYPVIYYLGFKRTRAFLKLSDETAAFHAALRPVLYVLGLVAYGAIVMAYIRSLAAT